MIFLLATLTKFERKMSHALAAMLQRNNLFAFHIVTNMILWKFPGPCFRGYQVGNQEEWLLPREPGRNQAAGCSRVPG